VEPRAGLQAAVGGRQAGWGKCGSDFSWEIGRRTTPSLQGRLDLGGRAGVGMTRGCAPGHRKTQQAPCPRLMPAVRLCHPGRWARGGKDNGGGRRGRGHLSGWKQLSDAAQAVRWWWVSGTGPPLSRSCTGHLVRTSSKGPFCRGIPPVMGGPPARPGRPRGDGRATSTPRARQKRQCLGPWPRGCRRAPGRGKVCPAGQVCSPESGRLAPAVLECGLPVASPLSPERREAGRAVGAPRSGLSPYFQALSVQRPR